MLDKTMADEQEPWIDTNPGPRNANTRQRDSLFWLPHISDPTFFINSSKPVKYCHIFHADIVNICQFYSANVSIYTSKFN